MRVSRTGMIAAASVAAAVALFGSYLYFSSAPPVATEASQAPPLGTMLQGNADNRFEPVVEVAEFEFPRDHGPHPEFQTEWWYFTGNLSNDRGERFGYQFTIFRRAVAARQPNLDSDWAGNQVYLAQAGVTDVQSQDYLIDEIYSREALSLAGAQAEPFSVWVEDWVVEGSAGHCEGCLNLSIRMESDEFTFDLSLSSVKPVVLHGDRGFSRKGEIRGNASYYYSLPRLRTTGTLTIRGESRQVSGDSWMDHEWFSSVLDEEQSGWDWVSLQLDDQRELMLFQIRPRDAAAESFKYGILIDQSGTSALIPPSEVHLSPSRTWRSSFSEIEYPVDWKIEIPPLDMQLDVEALLDGQERVDSFRYWEGAVKVSGMEGASSIAGLGYLEMTGY